MEIRYYDLSIAHTLCESDQQWLIYSQMAGAVWLYYMCKITELLDTIFFVLRKKQNQITFLHLYHHTLMPVCGFIGLKYFAGNTLNTIYNILYSNWQHIAFGNSDTIILKNFYSRRSWYTFGSHQLVHSRNHVHVLFAFGHGPTNAEIFVVEEIPDHYANRKLLQSPYYEIYTNFTKNASKQEDQIHS